MILGAPGNIVTTLEKAFLHILDKAKGVGGIQANNPQRKAAFQIKSAKGMTNHLRQKSSNKVFFQRAKGIKANIIC